MKSATYSLLFAILIAGSGVVEVQRNNGWAPIAAGEQINDGERIRTGSASSATVELGPGTRITLSQSSEIQVQDANVRTYTADARSFYVEYPPAYPSLYLAPYVCANPPAPPKR
jgi:hypothetical protein